MLPDASVAATFTVVTPTGNELPEGGLATRLARAQLSEAVGVKLTFTGHPPAALTIMFAGQETAGDSVSLTITLKEQVASGGTPFVAVMTTIFVPTGKGYGEEIETPPSL